MPEFIQTTSVNAKLEYLQIPQKDNEFLVNVAEPAGLDLKAWTILPSHLFEEFSH